MPVIELFFTFFMVGFVSFGGGYAIIPMIEKEVVQKHGWLTMEQFAEAIAVAGVSPGPIAANSAIFVGYQVGGISGAISSLIGIVMPSLLIILLVVRIFYKFRHSRTVKSAFYGLRPVITALVVYAALRFAFNQGVISLDLSWQTFALIGIFLFSFFALWKWEWHPAFVIVFSGLVGAALFS